MPSTWREADPSPARFRELMVAEEPDFDELLVCVFGVTEPVAEVYRQLLADPGSTVKELSRTLEYDRSNVNRKLDVLREKGLATRRRRVLVEGGVAYRYEPTSIDRTRQLMHRTLDEWSAFMHERIDDVESNLDPPD